ncbi:hypothetical protein BZM26_28705 [Paraburkholderia strydomiana]|nr:hypothetical protein BZM26_28705 [Paraburkholderia strydomiana]
MGREDVGLRLLAAGESSGNVAVRQRFIDAACQRLAAGELYRRSIGVIGMRGQAVVDQIVTTPSSAQVKCRILMMFSFYSSSLFDSGRLF